MMKHSPRKTSEVRSGIQLLLAIKMEVMGGMKHSAIKSLVNR